MTSEELENLIKTGENGMVEFRRGRYGVMKTITKNFGSWEALI